MNKLRYNYILLIALGLIALFGRLNDVHLGHEEPRRALIAQEILLGNNIWQPTLKGENYYRKPPLYNWIIALTYKITDSQSEFATRLPSVISYLLFILFIYYFFKKLISAKEALKVSVLVFIAGDILLYYSRMAEMDLFYALITFPVLVLPWWYLRNNRIWHFFLIPPLLAGLGFMSKGIPSLAFIVISSFVAVLITMKYKLLYSPIIILSLVFFLIPVFPYFYKQYNAGTFNDSWQTLIGESANRTTGDISILKYLSHFLVFPLEVLMAFLPSSMLLIWIKKSHFVSDTAKALLVIFIANFIVYWISPGARVRYIYMFMPIMAYFAVLASKGLKIKFSKELRIISIFLLVILTTALLFGMVYFNNYQFISILLAFLLAISILLQVSEKKRFWFGVIIIMLSSRAVFDFYSVQQKFLINDRAWNEKQQAIELHKKFPNKKLYLNAFADRYFAFCYEWTKLSNQLIEVDLDFADENAIYLVRKNVNDEKVIFIEDFEIGNDTTFKIVQCR
ncbi:MAG: glycosyltransferase family 39 protein [Bacteroidia bacterium]